MVNFQSFFFFYLSLCWMVCEWHQCQSNAIHNISTTTERKKKTNKQTNFARATLFQCSQNRSFSVLLFFFFPLTSSHKICIESTSVIDWIDLPEPGALLSSFCGVEMPSLTLKLFTRIELQFRWKMIPNNAATTKNIEYYLLPNESKCFFRVEFDFGTKALNKKQKKNHFMVLIVVIINYYYYYCNGWFGTIDYWISLRNQNISDDIFLQVNK